MEEFLTTQELLEEKIRDCIIQLDALEKGSDKHNSMVNDVAKLVAALSELEKTQHDISDKDRRFSEDMRFKDLELHYRDTLERDKMSEEKKSNIWNAVIKAAGIVIPTGLYFIFIGLGMRLEFIDNGSITSYTLKELLKSLHPRPNLG